jgi:hypothetical protein
MVTAMLKKITAQTSCGVVMALARFGCSSRNAAA